MCNLSAWTKAVHDHCTANGPTTMAEILVKFGEPTGRRTACDRMTQATTRGYFSKQGERRKAIYTAVPKEQKVTKWTPEMKALLAQLWPSRGEACAKRFPGMTQSACRKQAEKMRLRLTLELKRSRRSKREVERERKPRQCFGYIPAGAVTSVFDLGSRA